LLDNGFIDYNVVNEYLKESAFLQLGLLDGGAANHARLICFWKRLLFD